MNVIDYGEKNPARPSQRPTPEQYKLARKYVYRECPDLAEMLFGRA